jgi:hypothetical protein
LSSRLAQAAFINRLVIAAASCLNQGASDQVMNEHLVPKIINLCVVKLSNSCAIAFVPRLDLDYFESQADSPRLNQKLPSGLHL